MVSEEMLLRLVGLIYEAALNPDAWPQFLQLLAVAIGGHSVNLGYLQNGKPELAVQSMVRYDPIGLQEYIAYYGRQDPWVVAGLEQGVFRSGAIGTAEELVPKARLLRTEFYNDFGRRYGLEDGISGVIQRDEDSLAFINAFCQPHQGPFAPDVRRLLGTLMPHLQRAIQLHCRVTRLEAEREATAEAFQRLRLATIFLDAKGQVAFINGSASAILASRDGLAIRRRQLHAGLARETAMLNRLIAEAIKATTGKGLHSGGALAISRPSGKRAFGLLVTPLRSGNRYAEQGGAAAAVFIRDPDHDEGTDVTLLRELFGLTAAESRIAALVAQGHSFSDVIDRLGIAEATGRTHLKNIFAKTATRTQAQLVRLLLSSVPPVR
jgi:DNA-binding CsgD family transcriptional regulator